MKVLIGFILIIVSGMASAACPDIRGNWGISYDEVYLGDTYAGVGRAVVNDSSFVVSGFEGYQGEKFVGKFRGKYSVSPQCVLTLNFTVDGSDVTGNIKGVIINSNKMFLLYNSSTNTSGRAIAERMTET